MSVKIGINGFGRIGRLMFRQAVQDTNNKFKIMAINDSKDVKYLMYLLKYDSVHGKCIHDDSLIGLTGLFSSVEEALLAAHGLEHLSDKVLR